jgi:CHRD domain
MAPILYTFFRDLKATIYKTYFLLRKYMTDARITRPTVLATISALAFALVCTIAITQPSVYAQQSSQTFTAKLTGKDEVPPVNTQATGMAQFQLSSDGKELNYDLSTTNLQGFMMAHIHQDKSGENGQPVAPLQMGKAKVSSSDLQGTLAGKQISDLVDLMKNGGAYVNVHTNQNQNGEIRGQIMSGSSG